MPSKDTEKTWGSGGLGGATFRLGATIFLMSVTPFFCMFIWYLSKNTMSIPEFWEKEGFSKNNSSVGQLVSHFWNNVVGKVMQRPWGSNEAVMAWKHIAVYMAFQIGLMKLVPGKKFSANKTKTGHVPIYTDNGVACWFIAVTTLFVLWYNDITMATDKSGKPLSIPIYLYQNFGMLLSCMNTFALSFCLLLNIKGLNFPSTKDCGTNGNMVDDYWWGTELYPRIFGVDVKQFSNCRFGMMYWQLGIICYALAQYEMSADKTLSSSMFASVVIQTVYIFKFFLWETGYFNSMDIQHDRAGYYICWGCFVWLPSIYTMHSYFLVEHSLELSVAETLAILFVGLACVFCNYDCDLQRQVVRKTDGNCKIFGKYDPVIIRAKYKTETGEENTSILLVNGWWGIASHLHYLFEIGAAISWCLPAMLYSSRRLSAGSDWFNLIIECISRPGPWFYWVFLTILLMDRSFRDDKRCAAKYGKYWTEYRERVPYKVIPGVV